MKPYRVWNSEYVLIVWANCIRNAKSQFGANDLDIVFAMPILQNRPLGAIVINDDGELEMQTINK